MTKPKSPRGPVVFGPESLERVPPAPDKARAAGAPPAASKKPLVPLPRCPICRLRAATEVFEFGVVHVRTCPPCAGNAHAALRIFSMVKGLF